MWAATAWDDSDWDDQRARGWTVMGQLRRHRDRLEERARSLQMMSATASASAAADEAAARWTGGPSVLALLFVHPDTESIAALDARGEYFDHRTGDTWDLFFPGYYRARDPVSERRYGAASAWLDSDSEPTVDWATTAGGSLTDVLTGTVSVSLPEVIERLSREIEQALRSPDYGVPELTRQAARDVMTNAIGGIIAALGMKVLGG